MKKISIIFLLIFISVALVSCGVINKIIGKEDIDTSVESDDTNTKTAEEKLNLLFNDIKSSVDTRKSTTDLSDIITEQIDGLSFSIEDAELNGEKSDASVIFKENTLYMLIDNGVKQIFKIGKHGILTVTEADGQISSSLTAFDELTGNLPTIDIEAVLDAMIFKQGDLQKTDNEHIYTVNRSFLLRVGKALSGDSNFTIDKATAPTVTLDMSGYDTVNDHVIKLSIQDKSTKETTDIILSVNDEYEIDTKRLCFSIKSSNVSIDGHIIYGDELKNVKFDANITENGQETYFHINCIFEDNSVSNMLFRMSSDASELEIDADLSNNGDITKLKVGLITSIEENQTLNFNLEYDKSLASKVGENMISARLLLTAENKTPVNANIYIKTDEYSEGSAKYRILLDYSGGNESATGTAKIYFPAKSSPTISQKMGLYLNHGSKILNSYPEYVKKCESLNNEMMSILSSGDFSSLKSNYVTYDSSTDIYFLTNISYVNGGYVSTTYSSPDAFRYAYYYPQNLGGFKKEGSSYAERDALRIFELVAEDIPAGTENNTGNNFYTYTYIENYDIYLMVNSFSHVDFVVLTSEPTEEQTYNEANIHKLKYDVSGKVKIHTYEQKTSDSCMLYYECTHCKATAYPVEDIYLHSYGANITENDESDNVIWDFYYCQSCCKGKLNIYSGELTIELKIEEMSDEFMSELSSCEGFENFSLSTDDYAHSLVITAMLIHEGDTSTDEITEIVIPELSGYCDYSIVGIDNAGNDWLTECPLHIVISEGVEFINEHAFGKCRFLTKITLPSTLKVIGNYAFNSCINLTEVIFNSDSVYIAEDAFYNTSVEITT